MNDILMDVSRLIMTSAILIFTHRFGQRNSTYDQKGWSFFVVGLAMIVSGGVWDLLQNFDNLKPLFIVHGINFRFILENFLGYLSGMLLITLGLIRWLPEVELVQTKNRQARQTETSLRIAQDIYSRKLEVQSDELQHVYQTLDEAQARLEAVMEHSPAEIGVKSVEGLYIAINPSAERNFGRKACEIIGRDSYEILAPDVAEQVIAHDKRVLASGKSETMEITGIYDGRPRTYFTEKFPIRDATGTIIGLGAIATDITAKKAIETQLKASEQRYRELFEQSPVPFMEEDWSSLLKVMQELSRNGMTEFETYFDENPDIVKELYDGCISLAVSSAMVKLYGAASAEELQQDLRYDTSHPDEVSGFIDAVIAFFHGARVFEYQSKDFKVDGTLITTRVKFVIPESYTATWERVLVSIEDITDRIAVEKHLQVLQRFEAIGQLTGGVAHDFNNLLAVIQGNAELLQLSKKDHPEMIAQILHATRRGADLTRSLLAYSSKQILSPKTIDLNSLLARMNKLLARTLDQSIEIEFTTSKDLWPARADPGQVEDALLNLSLNARDAMPTGGSLSIDCFNTTISAPDDTSETSLDAGDYVVLSVTDTGTGMDETTRARAFEPFFTTKGVGDGSGLGLSMVYGFARQSGGQVTIDSKEGEGTTIKIYLPRETNCEFLLEHEPKSPPPMGNGETVFVIEDDTNMRELTIRLLTSLGYATIQAEQAYTARKILETGQHFDLVLSDIVLPGGTSGIELAEEVREKRPDVKIVFMSGYPTEAAKKTNDFNISELFLSKPFRRDALADIIKEALS
ncbi:ATP-binding protein [Sulfitobacter donghicola]|uniref:histidine kinase n=1 Tax=Sulfitobacter donghicola DSW-25 = KCTC 12864 = JCM 14565 TaxID=1300350 RepID=A0A073IJF0_9RHOB|nr:ATP-binding protein [Sulfitobacter donghicola]KEJ89631.1 hypothetical protein DSW25_09325 [Sulfitobacter donghicola DSW-25 = KCTC 12864 = JCM 14565]KIN69014.1 Multi-sensor hybrid histidine kinase [Sulfitobacter donghicola DSW-25 = KCTC 12864 = JCM 14565]